MRLCIFTLVFVLISSASAQALDASNSGQPSCVAHPGDEHGYLLKVCEYLQTHHIQATSDPNTWSIRRIENRDHSDKLVTLVYLSCCFLGDIAVFDASGEITEYAVGAK
jgi:hypothetical protein